MKRSREGYVVERTLPVEIREMICETAETYADYMLCCYALCVFPRKGIHETRMRFAKWTRLPSSPGVRAFGIPSRCFGRLLHVPLCGRPLSIEKSKFERTRNMPAHDITIMTFCTSSGIASVTRNRCNNFFDNMMFITSHVNSRYSNYRAIELSDFSGALVVRCRARYMDEDNIDVTVRTGLVFIFAKPFLDTLWRALKAGQYTFNSLWEHVLALEDDPEVRANMEMHMPDSEN